MTALVRIGAYVVEAHASWSAWAAQCGRCPWGGRLQRFTSNFDCPFCGAFNEVIWPSEDMVYGVERILMMRPDPSTRNWFPGETLNDLMWENGIHGIFDNLEQLNLSVNPGDMLFAVEENRIRSDKLPALKPRTRQQIGT